MEILTLADYPSELNPLLDLKPLSHCRSQPVFIKEDVSETPLPTAEVPTLLWLARDPRQSFLSAMQT